MDNVQSLMLDSPLPGFPASLRQHGSRRAEVPGGKGQGKGPQSRKGKGRGKEPQSRKGKGQGAEVQGEQDRRGHFVVIVLVKGRFHRPAGNFNCSAGHVKRPAGRLNRPAGRFT